MQKIISEKNFINYTGIDIVPDLIERNKLLFATNNIKFMIGDICTDSLPKCDLLIVRDVLFHLSNADLTLFQKNLHKTNFEYLLVSQHAHGETSNKDIFTGDFRELDIGLEPLSFPIQKALLTINDSPEWYSIRRTMVLFRRSDLFGK